jgi:hypothetical protein
MISKSHILHKNGQGQSLLEFALILPILILVLVGVFDLGRALFALITINNAAREGARYGTVDTNLKLTAVNEAVNSGILIELGDVTVDCPDDGVAWPCNRGTAVRVTVVHSYVPLLGIIIPTIDISRSVEMAVP